MAKRFKGQSAKFIIDKVNKEISNSVANDRKAILKLKPQVQTSPETYNPFSKAAVDLRPILQDRFVANNNIKKIKNNEKLIIESSVKKWQEETGINYAHDASIPKNMLTTGGAIKDSEITRIMHETENEFDLKDKFAFVLDDGFINMLIELPKTLVAQTLIITLSEHGPCLVNRQLLESTINGNKYLFMSDSKFYQDAPNATFPLFLLVNGSSKGICQISRIDTCGHINVNYLQNNGFTDIKIPPHILKRMTVSHKNAFPDKKSASSNTSVNAENHVHIRSYAASLMFAAAKLVNEYKPNGKGVRESEFLRFNAEELDPYYSNNNSKMIDAQTNYGIIAADRLVTLANNYFNFENRNYSKDFIQFLNRYREFKIKREKYQFLDEIKPENIIESNADYSKPLYFTPSKDNQLCNKIPNKILSQQEEQARKLKKQEARQKIKDALSPAKESEQRQETIPLTLSEEGYTKK